MSAQGDDGAGPSVPATAEPGPAPAAAAAAGAPAAPGSADAVRAERVAWAAAMRKLLSPPGAVAPDGSLVQEFFKPKQARATAAPQRPPPQASSACRAVASASPAPAPGSLPLSHAQSHPASRRRR